MASWNHKPKRAANAQSLAAAHPELGAAFLQQIPTYQQNLEAAVFAMGCFWGPEKMFREIDSVETTMTGYAGGGGLRADYKSVCSGNTGHCEVVALAYNPQLTNYEGLLEHFWTGHDPTQSMRQGNDVGSQYRSAIFFLTEKQREAAEQTRKDYGAALYRHGYDAITTEITPLEMFFAAEDYHQQYLANNPFGYCGMGGTGVPFPKSG